MVASPATTLALASGSCRDYAALFIEACRSLGLASRFVSGYLHTSETEYGHASTHAWAEVWLAGRGWVRIDPTAAVESIVPWSPGEAPVFVEPSLDSDLKPSALLASKGPADEREKGGVSVAVKGEVTGAGHRPKTPAERLGLRPRSGQGRIKDGVTADLAAVNARFIKPVDSASGLTIQTPEAAVRKSFRARWRDSTVSIDYG
mgnify:CR=1 FL=1